MLAKSMVDALQMTARDILNGKELEKIKFKVTADEGETTYKSPRYLKRFEEFNQWLERNEEDRQPNNENVVPLTTTHRNQ